MLKETFASEIARLKSVYGEKMYPDERLKLLWTMFGKELDSIFTEAIEIMIATCRSAPMMKEFNDAVNDAKARKVQRDRQFFNNMSVIEMLQNVYDDKNYQDPNVKDRIMGRIKLVQDFTTNKINKEQFEQGMEFFSGAQKK